jgi:hypothetical protein
MFGEIAALSKAKKWHSDKKEAEQGMLGLNG